SAVPSALRTSAMSALALHDALPISPVGASTPTGTLPFGVRAVSEIGTAASAVAEGRLDIAGVAGLSAWADTTTASGRWSGRFQRSEEHTSELQSRENLVCRLLLEKK